MSLVTRFPSSRGNEWGSLFRLLDDYSDHITTRSNGLTRSFAPRFDVRETKDAYFLEGELPGVLQEEVDIEFTDTHTIIVKGVTKRAHSIQPAEGDLDAEQSHKYWASERSFGQFSRTFTFPVHLAQDFVKASLKNGILSVTVPKTTAPTSKRIHIESD